MLPYVGALLLVGVLLLLYIGERAFERGRRRRALGPGKKRLPPGSG